MHLSLPGNLLCFFHPFKRFVTQVFVQDWNGKTHTFRLPQTAIVSDLTNQLSLKFKIQECDYWLSGPGGEKMEQNEKLVNLSTIHIRLRLNGGANTCCIKGCTEEASNRTISSLVGVYELKVPPDMLQQENDLSHSLTICNHHYKLQRQRGHKPRKLSAQKRNFYAKLDTSDVLSFLGIRTCTFCRKDVTVTSKTPCSQHTLLILTKPYMCACNCLDESKDGKIQEINSEKYNCTTYKGDHSDSEELRYINFLH